MNQTGMRTWGNDLRMSMRFNRFLDFLSEYLARRKGLLPILGMILVLVNAVLQFVPGNLWLAETNLFLHVGIILAILGFLLAWAL
jgi:hypothetical protein